VRAGTVDGDEVPVVSEVNMLVSFVQPESIAMRYEDEQDPKKPHPVRADKKKGNSIPIEAPDDDCDHHRHCC
jgi:predicted transcriptional regulator